MKEKPQILILGKKNKVIQGFADEITGKTDYEVIFCDNTDDFLKKADKEKAALIVTSEICQNETHVITNIREIDDFRSLPVIIILESDKSKMEYFEGFQKGPVDYIVYPVTGKRESLDAFSKISFYISSSGFYRVNKNSDPGFSLKVMEQAEPFNKNEIDENSEAFGDIFLLRKRIEEILEENKSSAMSSIESLVKMAGGSEVELHNKKVLSYIDVVCEKMRLPSYITEPFKRAAVLHDCFKYLLEKSTTNKKLSEDEKIAVKSYPYMLAELTGEFDFFANERSVLLFHHENYDGSGYPEGLKGAEIPLGARIFAVADAVVAMLSDRPYRKKRSIDDVKKELRKNAGKQFDPKITEIFISILDGKKESLGVNEQ